MSQVVQKLIFKEKTTNHNVLLEPLGLIRDLSVLGHQSPNKNEKLGL